MTQAVITLSKFWPILLLVLLFIPILVFVLLVNYLLYCYVFEHKSWVLWEKVCKALPYAKFISHNHWDEVPKLENYRFYIQNLDEDGGLEVMYWVKSDSVSVHKETGECVLSDFDKYHSNKAAKIIKTSLL